MKKILSSLLLASFLTVMVLPLAASAETLTVKNSCTMKRSITIGPAGDQIECVNGENIPIDGDRSICCLMNTIYSFADWIFVILIGVATIFIVIGAMTIIWGGTSGKIDTGKNYIMYAAIGLFVAFVARAIPGIIIRIIG